MTSSISSVGFFTIWRSPCEIPLSDRIFTHRDHKGHKDHFALDDLFDFVVSVSLRSGGLRVKSLFLIGFLHTEITKVTKTISHWMTSSIRSVGFFTIWRSPCEIPLSDRIFTHRDHKGHKDHFGLDDLFDSLCRFLCDLCDLRVKSLFLIGLLHTGHKDHFGTGRSMNRAELPPYYVIS